MLQSTLQSPLIRCLETWIFEVWPRSFTFMRKGDGVGERRERKGRGEERGGNFGKDKGNIAYSEPMCDMQSTLNYGDYHYSTVYFNIFCHFSFMSSVLSLLWLYFIFCMKTDTLENRSLILLNELNKAAWYLINFKNMLECDVLFMFTTWLMRCLSFHAVTGCKIPVKTFQSSRRYSFTEHQASVLS